MSAILDRPVTSVPGGGGGDGRELEERGLGLLQQAWLLAGA
jgi:hypothetical protein